MRHGDSTPVPVDALLAPDPELHMVNADMNAYWETHRCENGRRGDECVWLDECECDRTEEPA